MRAKIPWPVRIAICESAIRKQDEWVFKNNPRFVDDVVAATETRVIEAGVTKSLDFLCDKGCPHRELLYLLGMCENRGVTNAKKMTGFNSRKLPKKLSGIRECASTIWKLNGGEFGQFLEYPENGPLNKFSPLALVLREYSALVNHAVDYIGGKSDFYLSLAKALLENFVHERTKHSHDEKVADLLSAMLGEDYSADNHRNWRKTYLRRREGYRPDPADSPSLRMKKTLLEVHAATGYRMDILHPGPQYLRQDILLPGAKYVRPKKHTITRPE